MKLTEWQSGKLQGKLNHYWYSPITNNIFGSQIDVKRFQKASEKESGNEELAYKMLMNNQSNEKQCLQVRIDDDDKIKMMSRFQKLWIVQLLLCDV